MALVEDITLPVDYLEIVDEEIVDRTAELEVVSELVNGETPGQFSSTPVVEEALTKPILKENTENLAVTTVESVIESVIEECVDTSSAVEATIDVEDRECSYRDSSLLTKIENAAGEVDEIPVVEAVDEFPVLEAVGEVENKIELNEPIKTEANDEILDTAATESEATITDQVKDGETDVIAEKDPINVVATDLDGIEKRPIITLVMVAYVVFMAVFVFFN
eukprot:GFUD01090681.1.p1 GENE.GFUD01090681.1~~GFUD01090681.1.p1  ORF type:complete len:238 (-),score=73.26 GFUD01090681.1:25-687(-)